MLVQNPKFLMVETGVLDIQKYFNFKIIFDYLIDTSIYISFSKTNINCVTQSL